MLYNEAVRHLDEALLLLEAEEAGKSSPAGIEKFGRAVLKAQEIVTELMVSLDFERGGDIARNLFSVYSWFSRELVEVNISRDARRVTAVRNLIEELRGAWLAVITTGATETAGRESAGVSIAG